MLAPYAEGIASGKYAWDPATKTMSLMRLEDEYVEDGLFHSTHTGRTYDFWRAGDEPGYRAAIDDELDKPAQNTVLQAKIRAEHNEIHADPLMNLPTISDISNITWEHFPTCAQEKAVMDMLKQEAIALGIPIIAGTYCIDGNRVFETEYYKHFDERRKRLEQLRYQV